MPQAGTKALSQKLGDRKKECSRSAADWLIRAEFDLPVASQDLLAVLERKNG